QAAFSAQFDVEGSEAEDPEPEHGERCRDRQYSGDELTYRAPSRYSCDEDAHEGRPRDRPRPVEHRPLVLPASIGERVVPEGQLRQSVEIVADLFDHAYGSEE